MAEHRIAAEMENCGHLFSERLDRRTVYEVDAAVALAQPSGAEAMNDGAATESSRQ
jgi:hypothetical protein